MNKNTNTRIRIGRPLSCGSFLLALGLLAGNVGAAVLHPLESRLNGMAYFDPNLNITWAADADLVGETRLGGAQSAVDALVIEGVSGWRLPYADRNLDGLAEDCKGGTVDSCSTDNELSFMLKGTSKNPFFVIPAKAGIQGFQHLIDSRLRGNDDY